MFNTRVPARDYKVILLLALYNHCIKYLLVPPISLYQIII
nr:MAG TPA: hypothetical protein [Caudoviricetes sp.]